MAKLQKTRYGNIFLQSQNFDEFKSFFLNPVDLGNSVITICCLVLVFAFPLWVGSRIHVNFEKLNTKEVKDRYGVFTDSLKCDDYHVAQYNVYFMMRRLVTCAIVIFLPNLYTYQVQLLIATCTMNIIYLISMQPFDLKKTNNGEIFNELCIALICHLL